MNAIEVTIAKLEAKAGDTVVITATKPVTTIQVDAIKASVSKQLADGVKVMVMCNGLEVSHVIASDH